jgi:tagatose-1,6-bisphosphate aldolase non-catalytic subunit AgaZ/GatZ
MKNFTVISANDLLGLPSLSEAERETQRKKERAAYRKMLRGLCPLKELRRQAKRISKRQDSCDKCVYCDGETWICHYPHSDFYMEDLNIDHCYEGVLRYLVNEARIEEDTDSVEEETAALIDAPVCLKKRIYSDNYILQIVSGYLLDWADNKRKPPKELIDKVRNMYDVLGEVLPYYENLYKEDKY